MNYITEAFRANLINKIQPGDLRVPLYGSILKHLLGTSCLISTSVSSDDVTIADVAGLSVVLMYTYVSDLPHYRNFIKIFFLVCCLKPIQTLALQKIGSKVKSCLTTSLTILITLSISSVGACHQFSYQQHIVGDTRSIDSYLSIDFISRMLQVTYQCCLMSFSSNQYGCYYFHISCFRCSIDFIALNGNHFITWNNFGQGHILRKKYSQKTANFVENPCTVILLWLIIHRKVAK